MRIEILFISCKNKLFLVCFYQQNSLKEINFFRSEIIPDEILIEFRPDIFIK